jgi:hypothetical protein
VSGARLNLRYTVPERRVAFEHGLKRIGDPEVFVTWNRIGMADQVARQYEARGLPVIVAENAAWGNEFAGRQWYSLALGMHNTAGRFPVGDSDRFDGLGVELEAWRVDGERIVLPQRGIGPVGVAMPHGWTAQQRGRVRAHPGTKACIPLEQDLAFAGQVVTWGSGAAIKALMWGIPVESHMPNWIGEQNNTDAGRLAMFRRLAWAQWDLAEIASGVPFERLLKCTS